jgi:hypothetical protein
VVAGGWWHADSATATGFSKPRRPTAGVLRPQARRRTTHDGGAAHARRRTRTRRTSTRDERDDRRQPQLQLPSPVQPDNPQRSKAKSHFKISNFKELLTNGLLAISRLQSSITLFCVAGASNLRRLVLYLVHRCDARVILF